MKTVKVPLFSPVYKNVDGVVLNDNNAIVIDGYLDELGGSHRRPGLNAFASLTGTGNRRVSGVWYWPHKDLVIAVCYDKVFSITSQGVVTDITDDTPNTSLAPTFTTDGFYCYIASGGKILYTDGATNTAYISDADAPTKVSHVAFIDGYIIANEVDTNKWHCSDLCDFTGAAPVSWSGEIGQAVGDPDYIKSSSVLNREVYLLGDISTEIWENVGNSGFPFERTSGGYINVGCSAPYSVVTSDSSIFWLDHTRHFVRWSNGELQRISSPYDKEIQGYSSVGDCIGYRIEIAGRPFIVFAFPAESKTLVFDYLKPNWFEWRRWDSSVPAYYRFLGNCYTYAFGWGKHIVGSSEDSTIYTLSTDYYDDNGNEIRHQRVSGHIDYGTSQTKRCSRLRLRLKRGQGLSDRTPQIVLRYNDDNKGWSQEIPISLGNAGDTEIVTTVYPIGIYRTRQYEVTATDPVDIVYADAEEDIDILR